MSTRKEHLEREYAALKWLEEHKRDTHYIHDANLKEGDQATAKKNWVCNGYGTAHGYRNGRIWFVCPACRWKV